MYYPCSENKDTDQLRGYREADLRLCFRPCKLLVFSRTGSYCFFATEQNTNTWLQKISRRGNQPEDWLEYINLIKNEVTFPNMMAKHNFLNDLYEKALQVWV